MPHAPIQRQTEPQNGTAPRRWRCVANPFLVTAHHDAVLQTRLGSQVIKLTGASQARSADCLSIRG